MNLLDSLNKDTKAMLDSLELIVNTESPSKDLEAVRTCADELAKLGSSILGAEPERLGDEKRHLRWRFGDSPAVLILGHFDTVWPRGTVDRWPFSVDGDKATGPGIFDMKAGLIQGLFALGSLGDVSGIEILFNSDEEIGSESSIGFIEESARRASAVLVLEPSEGGSLKLARKGVASYVLAVEGRAAHSGLEPERGINAVIELAHQILEISRIGRQEVGTTVTPTVSSAGTTSNTVPAAARVAVDVRAKTVVELERVDKEMGDLSPRVEGAKLVLERKPPRLPFEREMSSELFEKARDIAKDLGLPDLDGVEVGGGSDGNITAALGVPTLDGLGAVGKGAHAEGEHISISSMPQRAALVAALVDRLRSEFSSGTTR